MKRVFEISIVDKKNHREMIEKNNIMKAEIEVAIYKKNWLTKHQASFILENAIDTLIEVGNGVSDELLQKQADMLIALRDLYINRT